MPPGTPIANNDAPSTVARGLGRHIDVAVISDCEQLGAIDGRWRRCRLRAGRWPGYAMAWAMAS